MSIFRTFTPHDSSIIVSLFTAVFTESESAEEGNLVGKLAKELMTSAEGNDLYGFVVEDVERIVGSIFFSRLTFESDLDIFLLSPVAVCTDCQGQGIGQSLIKCGLQELKKNGVKFVTTYGDPAFYSKVGFEQISQLAIASPHPLSQPQGWLGQSLAAEPIRNIPGRCTCVKALDNPDYW